MIFLTAGSLAVSDNGHHLYITHPTEDSLLIYDIDSAGNLPASPRILRDGVSGADGLDGLNNIEIVGDHLFVTSPLENSVAIFSDNSILLGENGNDWLRGGRGRDILIGGQGRDDLYGGSGDCLLISGFTSFDLNLDALNAISTEWISRARYHTRINNLLNGLGSDLVALKSNGPDATVFDDGDRDNLKGQGRRDWFLGDDDDDRMGDKRRSKVFTDIDLLDLI